MIRYVLAVALAAGLNVGPALAQSTATTVVPGYISSTGCNPGQTVCYQNLGTVTPAVAGSSASSLVLKAAPGNLLGVYFTAGMTQGWGMVFNATSAPGDGATTAGTASGNMVECVYVPADSTVTISFQGLPVEKYSVGITAVFSSTGCGTKTASTSAFIHGMAQ